MNSPVPDATTSSPEEDAGSPDAGRLARSPRGLDGRDRLLLGVAEAARRLLSGKDASRSIAEALAILGGAALVDRVYVCENVVHPKTGEVAASRRYTWTAGARHPHGGNTALQNIEYERYGLAGWFESLASGSSVRSLVRDFPAELKDLLVGLDIRSSMLVPITVEGSFWGFIGFDDCHEEREWSNGDEAILVAAAGCIGGAIVRHRAEQALHEAVELRERVMEGTTNGIFALDPDGYFTLVNRRVQEATGYTEPELLGRHVSSILAESARDRALEAVASVVRTRRSVQGIETLVVYRSGEPREVLCSIAPLMADGRVVGLVGTTEDVADRKRLEEQLRLAQRLESVGRLAGGIAHDFNNLLTAILGHARMARNSLPEGRPRDEVELIERTAERAAALTQQLLAFGRRQVLEPRSFDVNAVVRSVEGMLRRLIGENIDFVTDLAPNLWPVFADPVQLEQVVMNLVINARDAMPDGGRLVLSTANIVGGGPDRVSLSVADTGHGMDVETKARIFDPFFTTKESGTGLGLATVHGIVRQSGGGITVETAPGLGTTFRVTLPRGFDEASGVEPSVDQDSARTGTGSETVLVVEDEEVVRQLVEEVLEGQGYTVLAASNGLEAVEVSDRHSGAIHLLVSDVVMPGMGGPELAAVLSRARPGMRVLMMSGYIADDVFRDEVSRETAPFLQKPFTIDSLVDAVRDVLDN